MKEIPTISVQEAAVHGEIVVPSRGRMLMRRYASKLLLYIALTVGAVTFMGPLVWMLSTSFKPEHQVYTVPIEWIPEQFIIQNYVDGWNYLDFPRFYLNTFYLTFINIFGLLLSSSLVAFGFARIKFWGRNWIFLILLSTMMLPQQVTLIPIYVFWARLGLVNTYWPLIIPEFLTNAFNVFLLRQFFMSINLELDDAARMDGAGWFKIYSRILVPLSKPALGVLAIMAFTWNWNNFLYPLIYINEPRKYTIAIGLRLFESQQSQNMALTMAMTMVALVPVLVVFYIAQARFIQGIVITGVKG